MYVCIFLSPWICLHRWREKFHKSTIFGFENQFNLKWKMIDPAREKKKRSLSTQALASFQ